MYKMNPPTYDNTLNEHYEPGSPGSNEPSVYTVGELSAALKRLVEDKFGYIRVRGEVSGFKRATSGHLYMSLKDTDSIIDVVTVFQHKNEVSIEQMDDFFTPKKGKYKLRDYEKVFTSIPEKDIFKSRTINRREGCILIVRPDQHIACLLYTSDAADE